MNTHTDATPVQAGFAMPAEWCVHARTWMGWPCRDTLWGAGLEAARNSFADVARAIARFEKLTMLARPQDSGDAARMLGPDIEIVVMNLDDSWLRDSGPTFVIDAHNQVAGVDWGFNAWGGKFPPWDQDAMVAGRVLAQLGMRRFGTDMILEGGSFHTDGEGTLLTTEQCLLNENRNPSLTRSEIEDRLRAFLGVSTIVWLGEGLENDETDGHVDDIACFARPGVVLAASCNDPADRNHAPLTDNLRRLRAARDAQGRALEVIELPMPAYRHVENVGRLASSYVNFYLANGAVIMPGFDDPNDDVAAAILGTTFPDREIVVVQSLPIIAGGGSIHCITQQQPAGTPAPEIAS